MIVSELIEQLQQLPAYYQVVVRAPDDRHGHGVEVYAGIDKVSVGGEPVPPVALIDARRVVCRVAP